MKNLSRIFFPLLLTLCLPLSTALAAAAEPAYANSTELTDGFLYTNGIYQSAGGELTEDYLLRVSPGSSVYPIVMACDTIYGGMTIDTVISYAESQGYRVVGAMNADFGYWSTRIPCGTVVEDGIYKTSPEQNNALAFNEDGAFLSVMPTVDITLQTASGEVSLSHYNKTRDDQGGLYLYSQYFSTVSTRCYTDGWAVRFKVLEGQISVSGSMTLQVDSVYEGSDPQTIGDGYMILTAASASELGDVFAMFAEGDTVTLTTSCSDERLIGASWVTGCGDILLSGGELYHPDGWNSSIGGTHPRSCAGILPDGTLLFRVVDGRSENSGGATLTQLAEYFKALGCDYAVNFDGGGSSAMSLLMPGGSGASLINTPSDGSERSCPSYILFVTDAPSGGAAERLYLAEDGVVLLAGSSLPLKILAADASLGSAAVPRDARAQSAGGLGTVSGGTYTAGSTAGVDTISLSSDSAGIDGSASIHVITKADTLSVKDGAGAEVTKIRLDEGQSLPLSVSASYLSLGVGMDDSAVSYTVSGDIGTVSDDGLFTASQTWGAEGTVTVSAAGLSRVIPVCIGADFDDIGSHWARSYIETLHDKEIVNGSSATSFSPDASMKRGDFMLMLYRAAGEPAQTANGADTETPSFTDVPADAYYAAAISWAAGQGIALGTGDGKFLPQEALTREQAFTFVYRALHVLGLETPGDCTLPSKFSDADTVSSWAVDPTAALIELGLVGGSDDGCLHPQDALTRAQMAKILSMALYE
jgi:hypothetical protein